MKKYKKFSMEFLSIVFSFVLFFTYAYAGDERVTGSARQIDNVSQYKNAKEVGITGSPRGELISSVDVRMTDKGGGTLGVYADILCHEPMETLRIWLYLEKWIPEEEVWQSIEYEQFEWNAADFPDQDLTMAVAAYDIPNLERGQDYRIRGIFGAYALTSSLNEAWTMNTPDFFLE